MRRVGHCCLQEASEAQAPSAPRRGSSLRPSQRARARTPSAKGLLVLHGTTGLPASDTGLAHVARPEETSPLCFQVRLFLMLVCVTVATVLYLLLCSHTCLWPYCWALGERGGCTRSAPPIHSFQGYSRVPDGKVGGVGAGWGTGGAAQPAHASVSSSLGKGGWGCRVSSRCGREFGANG